jgi:hypothetical protein
MDEETQVPISAAIKTYQAQQRAHKAYYERNREARLAYQKTYNARKKSIVKVV